MPGIVLGIACGVAGKQHARVALRCLTKYANRMQVFREAMADIFVSSAFLWHLLLFLQENDIIGGRWVNDHGGCDWIE